MNEKITPELKTLYEDAVLGGALPHLAHQLHECLHCCRVFEEQLGPFLALCLPLARITNRRHCQHLAYRAIHVALRRRAFLPLGLANLARRRCAENSLSLSRISPHATENGVLFT